MSDAAVVDELSRDEEASDSGKEAAWAERGEVEEEGKGEHEEEEEEGAPLPSLC